MLHNLLPPILFGGTGGSTMSEAQLRSLAKLSNLTPSALGSQDSLRPLAYLFAFEPDATATMTEAQLRSLAKLSNLTETALGAEDTLRPLGYLFSFEHAAPPALVPFRTPAAPATWDNSRPALAGTVYNCTNAADLAVKIGMLASGAIVGGDVITLPLGMDDFGQFVLPPRPGYVGGLNDVVEIRSNISTAALDAACPQGKRMTPAIAASLNLAIIRAQYNNGCIVTDWAASGYRLTALRIEGKSTLTDSSGGFVRFGRVDMWKASQVCTDLVVDRCVITGTTDPTKSYLRGVSLTGPRQAVLDSTITDFNTGWTTGSDSQAVAIFGYQGPYEVRNSHLDALSEPFMVGGQQWGHPGNGGTVTVVSGAATFTASQAGYIVNGQAMLINRHRYVVSSFDGTTHATLTSTDGGPSSFGPFVFSIADPADPNAVPSDLMFSKNLLTRQAALVSRIPGVGTVSASAGAAVFSSPQSFRINSNIVVAGVPYRLLAMTDSTHWTLSNNPNTGNPAAFGSSAFSNQPTAQAKNGFEIKSLRRGIIRDCIMEHTPSQAQYGYAMLFKSIGDYGSTEDGTSDLLVTNIWCRSSAGGIQIVASADDAATMKHTKRIWLHDVLVEKVNNDAPWVENPDDPAGGKALELLGDLADITVEHVTWAKVTGPNAAGISLDAEDPSATPPHVLAYATGPIAVISNIVPHNFYGTFGSGMSEGVGPWNRYTNGFGIWDKNVMFGVASVTNQPAGTYAAATEAAIGYTDYAGGGAGYELAGSSFYNDLGTDGHDIGISDVPAFFANLATVMSGDPTGGGGSSHPMAVFLNLYRRRMA